MKGIERVMQKIIRERVFINYMQFSLMPGWGTTDAIFILRQLQKNIWLRTRICTLLLLTLKRHSIEFQEKLLGGSCENLALRNGLCSLYILCTTTPEVKLESIKPTLMYLESKLEFIRFQYLALCYLSFYLKLCCVSSAMEHLVSSCMLMT